MHLGHSAFTSLDTVTPHWYESLSACVCMIVDRSLLCCMPLKVLHADTGRRGKVAMVTSCRVCPGSCELNPDLQSVAPAVIACGAAVTHLNEIQSRALTSSVHTIQTFSHSIWLHCMGTYIILTLSLFICLFMWLVSMGAQASECWCVWEAAEPHDSFFRSVS